MMGEVKIFFRNDDVRNKLDDSLVQVTQLLTNNEIPIVHAVEPANVTEEVIEWLIEMKNLMPEFVEIIQHGYDHRIKNFTPRGEFGGERTYDEQYLDIKSGQDLMDKYFGDLWFRAFSFPYGCYNQDTLSVLNDLSYFAISTGSNNNLKRMVLNGIGRFLRRKFILKKPITYFYKYVPKTNLLEIPTVLNIVKKQQDENHAVLKTSVELINYFKNTKRKTIGVLLHHRFLKEGDILELEKFIKFLKSEDVVFSTMKDLYDEKMDSNRRPKLAYAVGNKYKANS